MKLTTLILLILIAFSSCVSVKNKNNATDKEKSKVISEDPLNKINDAIKGIGLTDSNQAVLAPQLNVLPTAEQLSGLSPKEKQKVLKQAIKTQEKIALAYAKANQAPRKIKYKPVDNSDHSVNVDNSVTDKSKKKDKSVVEAPKKVITKDKSKVVAAKPGFWTLKRIAFASVAGVICLLFLDKIILLFLPLLRLLKKLFNPNS